MDQLVSELLVEAEASWAQGQPADCTATLLQASSVLQRLREESHTQSLQGNHFSAATMHKLNAHHLEPQPEALSPATVDFLIGLVSKLPASPSVHERHALAAGAAGLQLLVLQGAETNAISLLDHGISVAETHGAVMSAIQDGSLDAKEVMDTLTILAQTLLLFRGVIVTLDHSSSDDSTSGSATTSSSANNGNHHRLSFKRSHSPALLKLRSNSELHSIALSERVYLDCVHALEWKAWPGSYNVYRATLLKLVSELQGVRLKRLIGSGASECSLETDGPLPIVAVLKILRWMPLAPFSGLVAEALLLNRCMELTIRNRRKGRAHSEERRQSEDHNHHSRSPYPQPHRAKEKPNAAHFQLEMDIFQATTSTFTHLLQLSGMRLSGAATTPLMHELLHPAATAVGALLVSFLRDDSDHVEPATSNNREGSAGDAVSPYALLLQESFSFKQEWSNPSGVSGLILSAISAGLCEYFRTLLQLEIHTPETPIRVSKAVPGSAWAAVAVHSKAWDLEMSSRRGIDFVASLTVATTTPCSTASATVFLDDANVSPTRWRVRDESRILAHNHITRQFRCMRRESQGGWMVVSLGSQPAVHAALVPAEGKKISLLHENPVPQQKLAQDAERCLDNARSASQPRSLPVCSVCEAGVSEKVASLETRLQAVTKQRDDLLECVSALRSDVELTGAHVVIPLQQELASMRHRQNETEEQLNLSVEVVKMLKAENDKLIAALHAQKLLIDKIHAEVVPEL